MSIDDITSGLGIHTSAMQQAAIDVIAGTNKNLVLLSPTGSGKTLAYLLPLSQLLDSSTDSVQAIVIVPGRELAIQSAEVLQKMKAGIRGYASYGGRPTMDEHREIRKTMPHVIFATPGRLNDHLDKGNFDTTNVRFTVIDEFDKCLEMGFADEMSRAVERLPQYARRIFLSATDMTEDARLTSVLSTNGFRCLDYRSEDNAEKVTTFVVHSSDKDKLATLSDLLCSFEGKSTIVFLNYRDSVERTFQYLTDKGFTPIAYHGGLDQKAREEAIYRFANGSVNVLVSTDLGSRGLDIPNVSNVVHYHLPETEEAYTHRVGRTARWDKTGNAFFLLGPEETVPEYVNDDVDEYVMPDVLPQPIAPNMVTLYIGKGKKDKISKGDIVGYLCKTGGLKGNEIGRIDVYDYYSYVAVSRKKLKTVLHNAQGGKIKGQRTKVEERL